MEAASPEPGPAPPGSQPGTNIGTLRGSLRYVPTSLHPELADRLRREAESTRLVYGEIVMEAVHGWEAARAGRDGPDRRRRRTGNSVRREIGLLGEEAEELAALAASAGLRPSAVIRMALEHRFGTATA